MEAGMRGKKICVHACRVLLQDFTGVPAVVDLAAMREAVKKMGGNPKRINPLFPAEFGNRPFGCRWIVLEV